MSFSGTFQVPEFSKNKSKDLPGGMGTLFEGSSQSADGPQFQKPNLKQPQHTPKKNKTKLTLT